MSKRWSIYDDEFLVSYGHVMGLDFVASHDLGHTGKGAGVKRAKKLKELGLWEKIEAAHKATQIMRLSWNLEFGTEEAKDIAFERLQELGVVPPSPTPVHVLKLTGDA